MIRLHLTPWINGDDAKQGIVRKVGQVVYRIVNGRIQILLVRSFTPGYDIGYALPKGHLEKYESRREGSAREVLEETGLKTKIIADLGTVGNGRNVTLQMFLGKYTEGGIDGEGNALDHDFENHIVKFFDWDWAYQNVRLRHRHWLDKALPLIKIREEKSNV